MLHTVFNSRDTEGRTCNIIKLELCDQNDSIVLQGPISFFFLLDLFLISQPSSLKIQGKLWNCKTERMVQLLQHLNAVYLIPLLFSFFLNIYLHSKLQWIVAHSQILLKSFLRSFIIKNL